MDITVHFTNGDTTKFLGIKPENMNLKDNIFEFVREDDYSVLVNIDNVNYMENTGK